MNLEKILERVFTEIDNRIDAKVNRLTTKCIDSENNSFNLDCEGNLLVNSITTKTESTHKIYFPIGTLYWNDNNISNTISECFEGTWERVKDVFILAAGDQYEAGTNGGEATHTLTTQEMPNHSHNFWRKRLINDEEVFNDAISTFGSGEVMGYGSTIQSTYTTGNNHPHNNMPPYHTSYCWKRVA